ncbi:hypothetical protein AB0J72_22850 [Dactylosporangium sp. NPDC049742]|uniref:hypothetical protein n=1 Tax=Dactylosporangium sp. NPDC049742 TaxID=3154737 RepID=UPI0034493C2B
MSDDDVYMELVCGDDFNGPCARCGAPVLLHVAESLEGDRITWTATTRCVSCPYTVASQDQPAFFDRVDVIVRQTLIARVGLTRLRADPEVNRTLRLRALALFRQQGATVVGAADTYTELTGEGLTGSPAEMAVLAARLTAAGLLGLRCVGASA